MIVRKIRLDKGLSQEQLAGMAGVSVRTLQRIERGAKASPETLKCLAAVLDTDFTILRGDPDMQYTQVSEHRLSAEEREAMEYVRDIKSFYIHAAAYVIVITGLVVVNLVTAPGYFWALWPALGWGIGLASHWLGVFEVVDFFGDDWEKRQIAKRLNRN